MRVPDPTRTTFGSDSTGIATTPKRQSSRPAVDAEIVPRLESHIAHLEQTVRFQQELMLKQQDALARQQDLTEKQMPLVMPPSISVPALYPSSASSSNVVSHPLTSAYLAGCLLLLTGAAASYMTGYFRHIQNPINELLIGLAMVLILPATVYTVAISFKRTLRRSWAEYLASVAVGVGGACMLALLMRTFYTAFAKVPHAPSFFWLMFLMEAFILILVNVTLYAFGEALRPAVPLVKNNLRLRLQAWILSKANVDSAPSGPV